MPLLHPELSWDLQTLFLPNLYLGSTPDPGPQRLGPGGVVRVKWWLQATWGGNLSIQFTNFYPPPLLIPIFKPLLLIFFAWNALYLLSVCSDYIHPLKPSSGPTSPKKPSLVHSCTRIFPFSECHCHLPCGMNWH